MIDADKLAGLVAAATKGPWVAVEKASCFRLQLGKQRHYAVQIDYGNSPANIPNYGTKDEARANAALIAFLRNHADDILRLTAALAERDATIANLTAANPPMETMMSDHMPELIWAEEPDIFDSFGFWHGRQKDVLTEYVRADIPAARIRQLEAERDALTAELARVTGLAEPEAAFRAGFAAAAEMIESMTASDETIISRALILSALKIAMTRQLAAWEARNG